MVVVLFLLRRPVAMLLLPRSRVLPATTGAAAVAAAPGSLGGGVRRPSALRCSFPPPRRRPVQHLAGEGSRRGIDFGRFLGLRLRLLQFVAGRLRSGVGPSLVH